MKDPTKELHEAYYTLLSGHVTVNGTGIPVHKWYNGTYGVHIGTTTLDENSSKDTYILDVSQEITIITELRMGDEREVADQISDAVVQLVTASTLMTMTNFDMLNANLSSVEPFETTTPDSTTYRKDLVFKHIIVEK